jgi:tRNA(fMet)-specific endonuclease VapC
MALYVLDTDTLTLLRLGQHEVSQRVMAASSNDLAAAIISVDEMLPGWYTVVRRATKPADVEQAYGRLLGSVELFVRFRLLNFTIAAIAEYDRLKSLKLNIGKNDLRIGAIALVNGATVATLNLRDFSRIPGFTIEDWSQPLPCATCASSFTSNPIKYN